MRARGLDAVCAPRVVDDLVRDTVLVTEWVEGTRLDRDASPDVPRLCGVANNAYLTMLLDTGELHCDPHPGNFAFRTDGSIVLYDFGAVKRLPEEDVRLMATLVRASLDGDWRALDRALLAIGARRSDSEVSDRLYQAWVPLLLKAFAETPFDFAQASLHQDVVQQARRTPLEEMLKFQPSSRTLLVQRVVGGHYWTMKNLGVATAFRPRLEKLLTRAG